MSLAIRSQDQARRDLVGLGRSETERPAITAVRTMISISARAMRKLSTLSAS